MSQTNQDDQVQRNYQQSQQWLLYWISKPKGNRESRVTVAHYILHPQVLISHTYMRRRSQEHRWHLFCYTMFLSLPEESIHDLFESLSPSVLVHWYPGYQTHPLLPHHLCCILQHAYWSLHQTPLFYLLWYCLALYLLHSSISTSLLTFHLWCISPNNIKHCTFNF